MFRYLISILKSNFRVCTISYIFVVLSIVILFFLGTWQIIRSNEKNEFLSKVNKSLKEPPVHLDNFDNNGIIYSKIKLSGKFLNNKNVFLYGNRNLSKYKNGYYLLSPFQSNTGKIFLVLRGWVADQEIIKNSEIIEEVTFLVMKGEKETIFVPKNDIKNNIWFTIDINLASQLLDVNMLNFYLIQIENSNLPYKIKPVSIENLLMIRNNHIEYAVTWYCLALILIIISIIKNFFN